MVTRRVAGLACIAVVAAAMAGTAALAADQVVKIGINLSLTGADAEGATRIRNGIMMAIDASNEANGIPGYRVETLVLDDGTATAGQYDPAQAAINARKMVVDTTVVAAIGPMASGSGKAMAPLLSQGNLATVTPSSTNPDLTDPKFAEIYRPAGKAIYFRTCTTDAFQGPNMANFMADQLKVKSVFVVDDTACTRCSVCVERCPSDCLYYARLPEGGGQRQMVAVAQALAAQTVFGAAKMVLETGWETMSSVEEGLKATLRLVIDPALENVTGEYFDGHECQGQCSSL
jgi:NAD-dependent dihydropyrimidine dehydrogenase PreA subunit